MAWRRNIRRGGFTLVEVLLVVVIIASLAAVAAIALWPQKEASDKDITSIRIEKVMQGLELFRMRLGYPTDEQGLKALLEKPAFDDAAKDKLWAGPYLVQSPDDLKDQWGHDLTYKLEEETDAGGQTRTVPHVYSWGPNGTDESGEGDDIRNKAWAAKAETAS
jgi:general secretion pathway protein G